MRITNTYMYCRSLSYGDRMGGSIARTLDEMLVEKNI